MGDLRSQHGRDALLVFFGLSAVLAVGLAASMRLRPDWFGLTAVAIDDEDVRFTPRDSDDGGAGADLGLRQPTTRRPTKPTIAELVFADAAPSVVHVRAISIGVGADAPTPIEPLEGDVDPLVSGTGSGVVWDRAGHIVTCKHVLDNVDGATVTFADGTQWSAKYVGIDSDLDLAVVRIAAPPESLTPVRVGTSADLTVGMEAFSVASPYGLGHSLSQGHVSGLGREIRLASGAVLDEVINTDDALHRGSSGGALIDNQGRVIGLNAAIHAESERSHGVGFSIPIDAIVERVPTMIERGYRWYPRYGFVVAGERESAERLAQVPPELGVPRQGLVVAGVDFGSAAMAAGLRQLGRQSAQGERMGMVLVRDIIVRVGVGAEEMVEATRESLDRAATTAAATGRALSLTVARRDGDVEIALSVTED